MDFLTKISLVFFSTVFLSFGVHAKSDGISLIGTSGNPSPESSISIGLHGPKQTPYALVVGFPATTPQIISPLGNVPWQTSSVRIVETGIIDENHPPTQFQIPQITDLDFLFQGIALTGESLEEIKVSAPYRVHLSEKPSTFDFTAYPGLPDDLPPANARNAAIGDLNGDGIPDIYLPFFSTGFSYYQNRLYLGVGDGNFVDATNQLPSLPDPSNEAILVDLDNDNDLDIIVANGAISLFSIEPTPNYYYLNDGNAHFEVFAFSENDFASSIAAADLDHDGDTDVIFSDNGWGFGGTDHVYLNQGDATFEYLPNAFIDQNEENTSAISLGDFNGDGTLDLVTVDFDPTGRSRLWIGNGDGTFFEQEGAFDGSLTKQGMDTAAGDLDADGDLDLVQTFNSTAEISVFLNDGNGFFTEGELEDVPGGQGFLDVDLGDLDGDGDLDFICNAGFEGYPDYFFLNDGNGAFVIGGSFDPPHHTARYPKLVDLDGVGETGQNILDLFMSSSADGGIAFTFTRNTSLQASSSDSTNTPNGIRIKHLNQLIPHSDVFLPPNPSLIKMHCSLEICDELR